MLRLCGTVGIVGGLAGCLRLENEEIDEGDGGADSRDEESAQTERQEDTEEQTDERDDQDGERDDQDGERDDQDGEFLERFRVVIESETDVEINSLHVEGNYVRLDYDSEFTLESQDGIGEIIEIATAYARVVRAGWEVDFLHAEFRDGDGDPHAFRIRTETALDWTAGEISDDEWHERILDNVQSR